jgi:hypothetical protein
MNAVMTVRQQIADYWETCWDNGTQPVKVMFESDDAFAAFYASKYLIQDTAEAVQDHLGRGFSKNPMAAYLEFWGVMQAIIIQQDAIRELYISVHGAEPGLRSLVGALAETVSEPREATRGRAKRKILTFG